MTRAVVAASVLLIATPALAQQIELPESIIELHTIDGGDCDPLEEMDGGVDRYDLGDQVIYSVRCYSAAYNYGYRFYIETVGRTFKALFAEYSEQAGWFGTDLLVNAGMDPATGILTSFYKGRGLGDCGTAGLWQWDGTQFVLVEYWAKEQCDGDTSEWPVIFTHPNPPVWPVSEESPTAEEPGGETAMDRDKISQ